MVENIFAFAKAIEDNVQDWLNAAEDIEMLLPRLPDYDRFVWAGRAKSYRDRAYEFERLLTNVGGKIPSQKKSA
jgi:hypothetical protein